jgi:hypothetical protein
MQRRTRVPEKAGQFSSGRGAPRSGSSSQGESGTALASIAAISSPLSARDQTA